MTPTPSPTSISVLLYAKPPQNAKIACIKTHFRRIKTAISHHIFFK
jgi:hypothetical protein